MPKELNEVELDREMKVLEADRRKKLDLDLILDWPTIGDASESALIKFF